MHGKDLIMATLFGGGSSSSGSGGGGGSSGGGGTSSAVSPKEVNFYDYDGTCVYAYSVEEAQALSELPAGPEHPGLVFQGWNWSLEGVQGLTRAMNIGAMYTTDDGTTRLYITLQEGRTSPMLGVGVNGTVTVDWGDGSAPDTLTGTSTGTTVWTENHAYAAPGDYVIRLTVDGEIQITGANTTGGSGCHLIRYNETYNGRNRVYNSAVQKIELSNPVEFGASAFYDARALEAIAIPKDVERMQGYYIFTGCTNLRAVTIPDGVTTIPGNAFSSCLLLATVALPENITSIDSYAFNSCYTMTKLIVPASVTSIGSRAFQHCYGMAYYDFTSHTAVPTLSNTDAFTGIPDDCEIRVPAALYDEWIAATNWATYADYIKAY